MAGASIHKPMHAAQSMVLRGGRGSNGPQTEISAYTKQDEMSSRSADSISESIMVPLPSGQMRQSNRNQSTIYCSSVQPPAHLRDDRWERAQSLARCASVCSQQTRRVPVNTRPKNLHIISTGPAKGRTGLAQHQIWGEVTKGEKLQE